MAERTTAMANVLYAVALTTFAITVFVMALLSDPMVAPQDNQASRHTAPQVTGSIVD